MDTDIGQDIQKTLQTTFRLIATAGVILTSAPAGADQGADQYNYFGAVDPHDLRSAQIADWQAREGEITIPEEEGKTPLHRKFNDQMVKWRAQAARDAEIAKSLEAQDVIQDIPEAPSTIPDMSKILGR